MGEEALNEEILVDESEVNQSEVEADANVVSKDKTAQESVDIGVKSSTESDNLPSRQKNILERLSSIRSNKQRIIDALRKMKENLKDGDEIDKDLMKKMIESYDGLSKQEEEYMLVASQIVAIRETAADDVKNDVGSAGDESVEVNNVGDRFGTNEKTETSGNSVKTVAASGNLKELVHDIEEFTQLRNEAVVASVMNEKLLETLQLHKSKRAALDEIHKKEAASQRGAASEALKQVELARDKVAEEQEQIQRKLRTLERLRQEALRRGIKIGPGSASEPDIIIDPKPEPKSLTEARLRAKLEKRKLVEETESNCRVDSSISQQTPPTDTNAVFDVHNENNAMGENERNQDGEGQQKRKQGNLEKGISGGNDVRGGVGGQGNGSQKKKKKGKRAREQEKERRAEINSSIREKLAAIEARKQRMKQLSSALFNKSTNQEKDSVDETFRKAQQQLNNLAAMRQHLEDLRSQGEDLAEEEAAELERQLEFGEMELATGACTFANVKSDSEGSPFDESLQVVEKVREEFERTMNGGQKKNESVARSTEQLSSNCGMAANIERRLSDIECELQQHRQMLEALVSRQESSCSISRLAIPALRSAFLHSSPTLLKLIAAAITDLANGILAPDFDNLLEQLCTSTTTADDSQSFAVRRESRGDDQDFPKEDRILPPAEDVQRHRPQKVKQRSASLQPGDQSFQRNSSQPGLVRYQSESEAWTSSSKGDSSIEQAKLRLNSPQAKLLKLCTLEKVRNITNAEKSVMSERERVKLEGLDKQICSIMERVLKWCNEHTNELLKEDDLLELRRDIVQCAVEMCYSEDEPSDLFDIQLSTIIDDTLSQCIGQNICCIRDQLFVDLSEVLYNELAFFQLMHELNSIQFDNPH